MTDQNTGQKEAGVLTRSRPKTRKPPMYRVLLHNDDYTTQDFVIMVLVGIFRKSPPEALKIMLSVHLKGVGTAGIYTLEVAETKVDKVHNLARANDFPLKCSMEPVSDSH